MKFLYVNEIKILVEDYLKHHSVPKQYAGFILKSLKEVTKPKSNSKSKQKQKDD